MPNQSSQRLQLQNIKLRIKELKEELDTKNREIEKLKLKTSL